MPFGHPTPRQPEQAVQGPNNPLTRAGGLYPSKNGKALTGSIRVDAPRRNSIVPFGDELIGMIREAMEAKVPLRALVFENDGRFPNSPPYNLNFSLGDRVYEDPATASNNGWDAPETETPAEPASVPPRPQRRAAPRRA